MKRSAWMLVPVALLTLAQYACQQAAPPTNSASTEVRTATPAVVDNAAVERELMRVESDWPRVLKEKDVEAIKRVEADDATFIYPDGSVGDKNQDVKDMETGALSADSWEVTDIKVKVIDADAAVATGRSIVKGGKYKGPDGKTIDISGEYRFADTFARRDGQWKVVAGISVPVRQPAGPSASPSPKASPAMKASPAAGASPAASASPAKTSSPR